ncbi:MAG: hypothetical protein QOF61_202 [Acidobacteriota bacterium]|nr:hypothetical protein [Acidobacteriota bacterium]
MHAAASPPAVKFARASRASVWRGIALDLTVVAANLFLLAPLARILRAGGQGFLAPGKVVGGVVSSTVGWLFLSVFAAHAIGAYLKLLPRQADVAIEGATPAEAETKGATRRARRRRESAPTASPHANKFLVGVVLALLLFHFFIFLTLLFSGWQSTGLQGWSPLFGENAAENTYKAFFVRFVLIIFILPLPTALVAIGLGDGADVPPSTRRTYQATELLADVLLYFSIVVITLVMNVLIAPRFVSAGVGAGLGLGDVLASLIPLALAFSILYLPPRLIYLAKDYKSPLAWLTILLALLSLAYRTFFPDGGFSW